MQVNANSETLGWTLVQFPDENTNEHETEENDISTTTERVPELKTTADDTSQKRRRRDTEKVSQNELSGDEVKETVIKIYCEGLYTRSITFSLNHSSLYASTYYY